jgi:hypothetical protein
MDSQADQERLNRGRSVALWAGVIGAPLLWGIQFEATYALSPWACNGSIHAIIHLVTIVAIVIALFFAYLSRRDWRAAGGSPEETDGGTIPRIRFLGALGMFLSLLSAMIILAQGIASLFFEGCWT